MCQCGCGDVPVEKAFRLPGGRIFGYSVYPGCSDCFRGPGITIYAYPNAKSEWLSDAEITPYKPTGDGGEGVPISFFEVEDLIKAAKAIGSELSDDAYNSVEDWLEDYGLQMMQDAMRLFEKRIEELTKRTKDRG